jgi:1-deoxy-D-xylulose-5-phosphate reductoisomerase
LRLACEAARVGRDAPTILNAANEVAVEAFLEQRIGFMQIADVVKETLSSLTFTEPESLGAVQDSDARARVFSRAYITGVGQ